MSALQPEKPPLGAWYLVTPGGFSSVKITDGLTFTEEETHEGKKLALVPRYAENGLIRFRVDASGIWLSVCHNQWQISGGEGVVVRPFPIFRPVDILFRDSVVHLRPDFSSVECEQAIELSLERVPEERPLLNRSSIHQLQNQLNESQLRIAAVAIERPPADTLAPISPLPEPGLKKIAGHGRPSSVRLIPDPPPQGEIPLLTDTVVSGVRSSTSVSAASDASCAGELNIVEDVVVTEPPEAPAEAPAREEANAMAIRASSDRRPPEQRHRGKVGRTAPKRRTFARLVAFAAGILMVSTDLPRFPTTAGITETGKTAPSPAADLEPPAAKPASSGVQQIGPAERSDSSRQLMAAVQALLESKSPPDPVTRQFVEDAMRVVNEAGAASKDRPPPAKPGSADTDSKPAPVATPESSNSRI